MNLRLLTRHARCFLIYCVAQPSLAIAETPRILIGPVNVRIHPPKQ
jgi:hypothetical protein